MSKFDCNECNETFKTKKDLIEHLKDDLDYYSDYVNSYEEVERQLQELGEETRLT